MGTGKSEIGKRLAKILKMQYVSTDDIIESTQKRRISDIFAEEGESYFRELEKDIVKKVSDMKGTVIATGGGVVLDNGNMENLKKNGILVSLNADPEEILKRTKRFAHRPLLDVPSPLDRIKELLEKRKPYYARADYAVDTTGKDINRVINEIIEIIRRNEQ